MSGPTDIVFAAVRQPTWQPVPQPMPPQPMAAPQTFYAPPAPMPAPAWPPPAPLPVPAWPQPAPPPSADTEAGEATGQLRRWLGANLHIGQVACWQLALALVGVALTQPLPIAVAAGTGALLLLALTASRLRERWLYEWAWCRLRFQLREHNRYLPREGGRRALLHLLAPDATVIAIKVVDNTVAVISRLSGATAVLRPDLAGADPVSTLPRPESLLPAHDDAVELGVQLVFHGVGGGRPMPWAWIAVQAMRTPDLAEEEELAQALHNVFRRVLRQLAKGDIDVAGLDEAALMHTLVSLAHVSDRRAQVTEQWRGWSCGSVIQAGFRLVGWADLDDEAAQELLSVLLTANAGAVVTIAVTAGVADGVPTPEKATMRVAAPSHDQLEHSIGQLRGMVTHRAVRLDRMDGEHAMAVAETLPLGVRH
jgi:type VII secretion protein EccE